jgi:hypothetical protein
MYKLLGRTLRYYIIEHFIVLNGTAIVKFDHNCTPYLVFGNVRGTKTPDRTSLQQTYIHCP